MVVDKFLAQLLVFGAHLIENFGLMGKCPFGGLMVLVGGLGGFLRGLGLRWNEDV